MNRWFIWLTLIFFCNPTYAQYFVRNLFTRYQWSEWLKNKYYHNGTNYLPPQCSSNSTARRLWNQAETALINSSKTLRQTNRWDDEITLLKECVHQDSLFCDAYFRLAQCLVEKTDWVGAYNILKIAERKLPSSPLVSLGLAQALLYLEYPTNALDYFEKFENTMPSSAEGYLGASMSLYELGRPREALDHLHQGIEKSIAETMYLTLFEAILYFELNETQKAYEILTSMELNPVPAALTSSSPKKISPEAYPDLKGLQNYYLGLCCAAKGESWYSKAAKFLKVAKKEGIEIDSVIDRRIGFSIRPSNLKEQMLSSYSIRNVPRKKDSDILAQQAFENRKTDDAITFFGQSLKQDSTDEFAYVKLAECYQLKGSGAQALRIYELANRNISGNEYLQSLLARQYVRIDSLPAALKMHERFVKKKPKNISARLQLCLLLAMLKENQKAIEILKPLELRFADHWNGMPWQVAFMQGELFYLKNEPEVASRYFQFAAEYGSFDPRLNYYYGICLGDLEYLSDAKKYLYKAMELGAIIDKAAVAKFRLVER